MTDDIAALKEQVNQRLEGRIRELEAELRKLVQEKK